MWTNLLKFLAVLLLKNRMEFIRNNFFNQLNTHSAEDLNSLKDNIAAMAESRAAIFKQNFNHEVRRVVNSLFGFMLIMLAAISSLLTGLAWLFASAWASPNRDIILGLTMLLPILIAVGVYFYIRQSWQKQPILQQSMQQIESDWQVFRTGLDSAKPTTSEASNEANR
jgi:uncharacterized membrane protein YqjE